MLYVPPSGLLSEDADGQAHAGLEEQEGTQLGGMVGVFPPWPLYPYT